MAYLGGFSDEALQLFQLAASERGYDEFAEEGDTYDFTRCVRPNGTFYGTRGKCKSGSEAGAKKEEIKRDSSKDVKRGSTLIGTSPKNMAIDNLNSLKKEYEDYKKKFGHRDDLKNVMETYEKRIAAGEKFVKGEAKAANKPATRDEKVNALRDKVSGLKASGDKKKLAAARGDLQGQERMRKIESTAKKEGKTPDDVIRERNAAADKKTKARLSEKYPQLASGANKGGDAKSTRKPLATAAEAKAKWLEAEKAVEQANAHYRRMDKENKNDKSPEAQKRVADAGKALHKAELFMGLASDRYFAARKREDRSKMTPEGRKLEREADKLTKGG